MTKMWNIFIIYLFIFIKLMFNVELIFDKLILN
jgi:hypothetical protein